MKKYLLPLALIFSSTLFADNATGSQSSFSYVQLIIMLAIFVLFYYFILHRPEQKRRKKMTQMRESLKKGDKITAMGIIGTVSGVKETTVIVKMYDGAKVEFLKAAISEVQPVTEPAAAQE